MRVTEELDVVEVIEQANLFKLSLLVSGITTVEWSEEVVEITKDDLLLLKQAIKEIGGGKKMRVFICTQDFSKINKEAMEHTSKPESSDYTLANAVLVNNLAKKILFNFYIKFDKPTVPTKAFNSRKEGFNWLLSIPDMH